MLIKIINDIKRNWRYLVCCALLSLYALSALVVLSGSKKQLFTALSCAALLFLLGVVSRHLFAVMFLLLLLVSSILFHMGQLWGVHSVASRLQAAYLSPTHESLEYLANYGSIVDVILVLYVLVGAGFAYVFHQSLSLSGRGIRGAALALFVLFLALLQRMEFPAQMLPYVIVPSIVEAAEWKQSVNGRLEFMSGYKAASPKVINAPLYEKVVVIMGESVNRAHTSAYGYSVNTTPFLKSYVNQTYTYKFDRVVSPANQTRYAVPIMLSDATVEDFLLFNKTPSLVTTLKTAGYKTYWLSNQYSAGKHDSYIATIAAEADVSKTANFAYESGGNGEASYDEVLLSYIDELKNVRVKNEAFFFHFLGSHFQYSKRCPEGGGIYSNPKNVVEHYDNSVYCSDIVMAEIYKRFSQYRTLFVFTSDHGEVVSLELHGHGFLRPSYKEEYQIPLVIGSSIKNDKLESVHRESEAKLVNGSQLNRLIRYIIDIDAEFDYGPLFSSKVIAIDKANVVDHSALISNQKVVDDI